MHLQFDLVVLLGGPQSVANPKEAEFFKPYFELVQNISLLPKKKCIGVCLGSQIIAKALGGDVKPGDKGPEVGFSPVAVTKPDHPIFKGVSEKMIQAFHLHEDVVTLPTNAELLLKGDMYPNQLFAIHNRIFGFQTHLEPTLAMLQVWMEVHEEFIAKGNGDFSNMATKHSQMMAPAQKIFRNIINL
jgi:GMP synthase-like glutamine amidotransferase